METERSRKRKRRRYILQLKAQILAECEAAGASVANVELAHGINDNVVHGWRQFARQTEVRPAVANREFVPVAVSPAPQACNDARFVEIELRRGTVTITLSWPVSAAVSLAAWTRELLR